MNNYVLYDSAGRVTGIVTGPSAPTAPEGGGMLQVDAPPGSGNWSVSSGAVVTYVPNLADNQEAKTQAALAQYSARIAAGFTFSGTLFQIDPVSQGQIAAMGALALGSIADSANSPWNGGFYWVATDNSHVPMDAATTYAFARAVALYVSACILHLRAIKDAIAGAADQAALDAIDVSAGYPAASA